MQSTIRRRLDVLEQLAECRPDVPGFRSKEWQEIVVILMQELTMDQRVKIAARLVEIGQ